eukprot:scaffold105140_cov39-Tisochrysis_lutea.AAC.2
MPVGLACEELHLSQQLGAWRGCLCKVAGKRGASSSGLGSSDGVGLRALEQRPRNIDQCVAL